MVTEGCHVQVRTAADEASAEFAARDEQIGVRTVCHIHFVCICRVPRLLKSQKSRLLQQAAGALLGWIPAISQRLAALQLLQFRRLRVCRFTGCDSMSSVTAHDTAPEGLTSAWHALVCAVWQCTLGLMALMAMQFCSFALMALTYSGMQHLMSEATDTRAHMQADIDRLRAEMEVLLAKPLPLSSACQQLCFSSPTAPYLCTSACTSYNRTPQVHLLWGYCWILQEQRSGSVPTHASEMTRMELIWAADLGKFAGAVDIIALPAPGGTCFTSTQSKSGPRHRV